MSHEDSLIFIPQMINNDLSCKTFWLSYFKTVLQFLSKKTAIV